MMRRCTIPGFALVSVVSGVVGLAGAVVIAQAQEPVSLPRYAAYPRRVAEELVPLPPPPVETLPFPGALDSNEFIDKGQSLASVAIKALTAERDGLQERLKQIDQELARWNAIQKGLSSAKDATPSVGPGDRLELTPLPEPAS